MILFQSLLHQGISLLAADAVDVRRVFYMVSIPSSSGHQFTENENRFLCIWNFMSFNPFFIRASVY